MIRRNRRMSRRNYSAVNRSSLARQYNFAQAALLDNVSKTAGKANVDTLANSMGGRVKLLKTLIANKTKDFGKTMKALWKKYVSSNVPRAVAVGGITVLAALGGAYALGAFGRNPINDQYVSYKDNVALEDVKYAPTNVADKIKWDNYDPAKMSDAEVAHFVRDFKGLSNRDGSSMGWADYLKRLGAPEDLWKNGGAMRSRINNLIDQGVLDPNTLSFKTPAVIPTNDGSWEKVSPEDANPPLIDTNDSWEKVSPVDLNPSDKITSGFSMRRGKTGMTKRDLFNFAETLTEALEQVTERVEDLEEAAQNIEAIINGEDYESSDDIDVDVDDDIDVDVDLDLDDEDDIDVDVDEDDIDIDEDDDEDIMEDEDDDEIDEDDIDIDEDDLDIEDEVEEDEDDDLEDDVGSEANFSYRRRNSRVKRYFGL